MNKKQIARINSFKATKEFFSKNKSVFDPLPGAPDLISVHELNCGQIDNLAVLQGNGRSTLTESKGELRADLIAFTLDVSKRMKAYATIEGKKDLIPLVNVSASELNKMADQKVLARARGIYDQTLPNVTLATAYGITAERMTAFLALLNDFNIKSSRPKVGKEEQKQVNLNLELCIQSTEENLVKMDILVELIREPNAELYRSYLDLRRIASPGHGTLALKGKVTDAASGLPVKGVNIVIDPAPGNKHGRQFRKMTTVRGGFTLKSMAEGKYVITASKGRYLPLTVTVTVINGERTEVHLELQAE
jgi:hypothetical protein